MDCEMISVNNNNRNNCGRNETLFWKVFSNIYLLKYIINTIQTVEWVIYDDHRLIGKENRWKFKDIYSLDWMIESKQYPLLKCKIENNDYIHFGLETVKFIFEYLSTLTERFQPTVPVQPIPKKKSLIVKSTTELELEKQKKEFEKQQEIETLIGFIKLLLEKKRMEFEICDLTKAAVEYDCLDAIKILTSEPYSIIVYPSTLELAISVCHPSMVQHLLSLNQFNLVTDEIKYRSLKLASQNEKHHNEMIKFILDNPSLYQVPPTTNKELSLLDEADEVDQPKSKKKKIIHHEEFNDEDVEFSELEKELKNEILSYDDDDDDELEEKSVEVPFDYYISFAAFNRLESIGSLEKLMELDMVSKKDSVNLLGCSIFDISKELKITRTIEEMMVLLKIHFKYCNEGHHKFIPKVIEKKINKIQEKYSMDQHLKFKEFIKFIILKFKPFGLYNQFMVKYEESIDECQDDGYYLDDCSNEIERKFLMIFRFIGGFKFQFGLEIYKKELIKCMDKVKKNKLQYYPILGLIDTQTSSFTITNKQVLDWLIKCDLSLVNTFIDRCLINIEYSSIELLQYAKLDENKKLTKLSSTSFEVYIDLVNRIGNLEKCFYNAIQECNIDKLIVFENPISIIVVPDKLKLPTNELEILKLIKYFNVSGYISFNFFSVFVSKVIESIPTIELSTFQIDSNSICNSNNPSFIDNLLSYDSKLLQVFLNTFSKPIIFPIEDMNFISDTEMYLFNSSKSIFYQYEHDENEILSCAKLYMNKYKIKNQDSLIGDLEKQSFQTIFNFYFEILIQIKSVPLELVYSLHQLMVDNSFTIKHTFYHSFYYLQLRNAKLIKYILSRPGIDQFFAIQQIQEYSAVINYEDQLIDENGLVGYNLQNYLDFNEFTFDYVLGGSFDKYSESFVYFSSFDEILGKLVMQLSINIITEKTIIEEFFVETMNADLYYYLEIKRFDLFFRQLQFIQSKLDETSKPGYEYEYELEGFPLQYSTHCSPANELLPTSTLFTNIDKPKRLPMPTEEWRDKLLFPCSNFINTFKFLPNVIDLAAMLMDTESIQKFISFNFYQNGFHNNLLCRSIWWSRFDIAKFIFDNYNVEVFAIPIFGMDLHYNYQGEFKFLYENYPEKIPDPRLFKVKYDLSSSNVFPLLFLNKFIRHLSSTQNQQDFNQFISNSTNRTRQQIIEELMLVIYNDYMLFKSGEKEEEDYRYEGLDVEDDEFTDNDKLDQLESMIYNDLEIQLLIKSTLDNFNSFNQIKKEKEIQQQLNEFTDHDDSTFSESFINGDIKMCNLILNQFPSIFKITKQSIKKVIKSGKIHIVKYFYNQDNCKLLINNFQSDKELFNYLKQKLSVHQDYKFDLNWL